MISPANTTAVIVGVENYTTGPSWRLDGPALDACRFARWLTQRGVPADRITLLVSPLPENETAVSDLSRGFIVGSADSTVIHDTFTRQVPSSASELLIVYWGGHGVIDQDDRHLIYADATEADKRNLNLTALLSSLRSGFFPHHPRQLFLVDACQTLVADRGWATTMPTTRFPVGRPAPMRDQRVLIAASPGEVAINDDRRKSGLFSRVVQEMLDNLPAGSWPPNPDKLRDAVNERFHGLREAGKTEQMPSYVWFRSRSGEETLVFATAAPTGRHPASAFGCQLLNSAESRMLRRILDGAPAPTGLRAIYREATRNLIGIGLPRRPDDLASTVEALRGALSPMPLFEFLVRLAAGTDAVTQQRLWAWIRETAPGYSVDLDALQMLDEQLQRTVLLLRMEPDLIEDGYQVTVWTYDGSEGQQSIAADGPWTRDRVAQELGVLLEHFDPDLGGVAPIIEFMVPLPLLDEDVEAMQVRFTGNSRELGLACPVVVRSLDRLAQPQWCGHWQEKWRELSLRGEAYDADAICWVECSADDVLGPTTVCTALAYKRPRRPRGDPILQATLEAGTPVVLWHRSESAHRARRLALERVLRGRALRELPDVVLNQRVAARFPSAPDDHAGRGLVLLWDDPDRVPPDLQWRPPAPEGAAS